MPSNGIALMGYMDQAQAVSYLRGPCVPDPAHSADADLINQWNTARANMGMPLANAGRPDIQPIPASHAPYVAQLRQIPWVAASLLEYPGSDFQYVEIAPLLAFQYSVDLERSQHHCGNLPSPPSLDQVFHVCLPMNQPQSDFVTSAVDVATKSVIVKTRNLNLRGVQHGVFNFNLGGMQTRFGGMRFQDSLPFVHVVRLNGGLCFLFNGYHRTYGCARAGATYAPCLFRDVGDFESAGVKSDGSTFPPSAFQGANMPTVSDFTNGHAHPVRLRQFSRVLHFTWSEYALPDE